MRSLPRSPRPLRRAASAILFTVATAVACTHPGPDDAGPGGAGPDRIPPSAPMVPEVIPFEEVARHPQPGMAAPSGPRFVPGTSQVTYLHDPSRGLARKLFLFDPATGESRLLAEPPGGAVDEEDLPPEEKLRRERMRERGLGLTRYAFAKHAPVMVVPLGGHVYVKENLDAPLRLLVSGDEAPAQDPQLSPDGRNLAFVRDDELFVVPTAGGTPRAVTTGARGTGRSHGLAEYIAQEEMGRHHGFWWSEDGELLAFTEVDEGGIPVFRINHLGDDRPTFEDHRYPFAGGPNARVRLGVVPAAGGRPVWMDLAMPDLPANPEGLPPAAEDIYLARVRFMPSGELWVQLEDRRQQRLDLVAFDPRTGKGRAVLSERSDVWINLHDMLRPIDEGPYAGHFLWASERDDFRHLYLYRDDGTLVRRLTEGPWQVDAVHAIDAAAGTVYLSANEADLRERHLYAVPLGGGPMRRLTPEAGTHQVVVHDGPFDTFVDLHSAVDQPPRLTLRDLATGEVRHRIYQTDDPRIARYDLRPPELLEIAAADGTPLYAALYRPANPPPWRLVVSVYGGPHVQRVQNSYALTADLRTQRLRAEGVAVLKLDNRGSARRGLAFEGAIRHDMGNLEVRDQAQGVRHLVEQALVDPNRVGIHGWSYGGYMSAMALMRAPETFKVAVAGAPVTSWDGYDTHYTERYMGLPQENVTGYRDSAVMTHADDLVGHLLLVHGLIDENVHARHTLRLVNRLIALRKPYDILLFPSERHMPRRIEDRVYLEEQVFTHLLSNL